MTKTGLLIAASLAALLSACGEKESKAPVTPPASDTPAGQATTNEPPANAATTNAPSASAMPAQETSPPAGTSAEAPTMASQSRDGEAIYKKTCAVCHGAGIGGAPKLGDDRDWGMRVVQGRDVLYKHAIEGFTGQKGMMPPRGANPALSDEDVKAAVDYMLAESEGGS